MRNTKICLLFVATVFLSSVIYAQSVTARLEGVIRDTSGNVIAGAKVVATNVGDNRARATATNESGRYIFPNLQPGAYSVSVQFPGFQTLAADGIVLRVDDSRSLDLVLQIGQLSEVVTVTGDAPVVNVSNTKIGAVVENRQAVDLPLNGRDAMMLIYLQGGTNPLDRLGSQQQNGVVDGLAPSSSAIKVEGIAASNPGYDYSPSHPSMPVPQEAVGEYSITTSSDTVESGRGAGAQVKVLIKSGTNQFHGNVFEFNRNTAYNANNYFNNRNDIDKPVLLRNQFGFSFGGPIIRDKTFFFTTAEWQREVSASVENATVYTQSLREGIFRYYTKGGNSVSLVNSDGSLKVPDGDIGTIDLLTVDPSRQGLDTAFIPTLFPQLPLPNNYDVGDGLNTAGYRYNSSLPNDYYQFLIKVDHALTDKHQIAFTYSQYREHSPLAKMVNGISPEDFIERRRGGSLRITSNLLPNLVNELSIGANIRHALRPITNTMQLSPAGNIQLSGLGGNISTLRSSQSNPAVNEGFSDAVTWMKGNHSLNFGGEFWFQTLNRRTGNSGATGFPQINTSNSSNPANVPALPGLNSSDRSRAQQLVNDLTGTIGQIYQTFYLTSKEGFVPYTNNYQQLRKREGGLFIQDNWKILPNLSLNVGLRYEVMPPIYIANGAYAYPINGLDGALGIQGPLGEPTRWGFEPDRGSGVFKTDLNNFGPNIGIAWDPFKDGLTSIRAGYRIAYDRSMIVSGDFSTSNYGTSTAVTLTPSSARLSDLGDYLPLDVPQMFPVLGNTRESAAYVVDPNSSTPYTQSWSIGIQRELPGGWKVDASYVGNHAIGMWHGTNLNQVEIRDNGFLDAFKIAQKNLADNGNILTGQPIGTLEPLFSLLPASQNNLITQGQVASLANYIDTTTLQTGVRGGLLGLAGLPDTFFRFNPQVTDLWVVGNYTQSTWNGLKLSFTKRYANGFHLQANYTYGKGYTNNNSVSEQTFTSANRDKANTSLDRSCNSAVSNHVAQINWVYELPIGKGKPFLKNLSGWQNYLLGGWQLNGIYYYASGRPISITTGRYNLNQSVASLPDFNGSFTQFSGVTKGDVIRFISPEEAAAFSNPEAGSAGNLQQYYFDGPGYSNLDASLFKTIPLNVLREGASLQFRAEFFNVLNQVNFGAPNTNINNGSFGVISSTRGDARIGQFALKVNF
jgi:hypothetical protein